MSHVSTDDHVVNLNRIEPVSAFKLGLLVAFVASIVTAIVLSLAYLGLDKFGVVSSVNESLQDLAHITFNFTYVLYLVVGLTVMNFILLPIAFTVSAWIYNLCAAITGGLKMIVEEEQSDI